MSTILAVGVCLGFLWSLVLFFVAVFERDRPQEVGFYWALIGAAVYLIVFSDRLPGSPTLLREPLELLPGVGHASARFVSPLAALIVLVSLYAVRIAIFYELFVEHDVDLDGDGEADDANDIVAPVLSYLCLVTCAVAGVYGLYVSSRLWLTPAAAIALLAAYFMPLLWWYLIPSLQVVWANGRLLGARAHGAISKVVMRVVLALQALQLAREGVFKDTSEALAELQGRIDGVLETRQQARRAALDRLSDQRHSHSRRRP